MQNKLPTSKAAIRKVETLAEWYILLDLLLFKITPEKETAVLAVPEACADKIIIPYHSSLFAGHQGVIKLIWQLLTSFFLKSYALSQILHQRVSYLSINMQWETTHKATPNQNKPKLYTFIKIEHGFKSYA